MLICGESGTGKELVAQAIHALSRRAAGPLVSLNCPVLSAQLTESELFGHKRGAFTGAEADRTGRFELADGGSILLDEVTEIDLTLQAKLLRVLQERSFERVGSSETVSVDVRVLATTNRDLPAEIAAGRFREDFYFRLAVVPLVRAAAPRARRRRAGAGRPFPRNMRRSAWAADRSSSPPSARELLAAYDWPGNVRELQNIVTRACVLNQGQPIGADELRPWLAADRIKPQRRCATARIVAVAGGMTLEEVERRLIETTLGPVRRSSRENGRSPRHRPPHAQRQAAAVRLRTAREEFCQGRLSTSIRQNLPDASGRNCRSTTTLFTNTNTTSENQRGRAADANDVTRHRGTAVAMAVSHRN